MTEWKEPKEPGKFKVELLVNGMTIHEIYYVNSLEELYNKIHDQYPKGKIVTIIGA